MSKSSNVHYCWIILPLTPTLMLAHSHTQAFLTTQSIFVSLIHFHTCPHGEGEMYGYFFNRVKTMSLNYEILIIFISINWGYAKI